MELKAPLQVFPFFFFEKASGSLMINIIDSFIQYIFIFRLGIPRKIGEREKRKSFRHKFSHKRKKAEIYIFLAQFCKTKCAKLLTISVRMCVCVSVRLFFRAETLGSQLLDHLETSGFR
jgi:hypothetical protein